MMGQSTITEARVRDHLERISVLDSAESSVAIHDDRHMTRTPRWNERAGTLWSLFVLSPLN